MELEQPVVYSSIDSENMHRAPQSENCTFALACVTFRKPPSFVDVTDTKVAKSLIISSLVIYPRLKCKPDKYTLAFWDSPENVEMKKDLLSRGDDVDKEMLKFKLYYTDLRKKYKVVFIAYPAAYDWQFLNKMYWDEYPDTIMEKPYGWEFEFYAECIQTLYKDDPEAHDPIKKKLEEQYGKRHEPLEDATRQGLLYIHMKLANKENRLKSKRLEAFVKDLTVSFKKRKFEDADVDEDLTETHCEFSRDCLQLMGKYNL